MIYENLNGVYQKVNKIYRSSDGFESETSKRYENENGVYRQVYDNRHKVFVKNGILIDANIPHTFLASFSNSTVATGKSEITQENGYVKIKKNLTYTGSTGGGSGKDGYIYAQFDKTGYDEPIIKCITNYIYVYYACSTYSSSDGAYQVIGTPNLYVNWNRGSNYTFTDSNKREMTNLFCENALWRGNYSKANRTLYLNYEFHVLDLSFE